VRAVICLVGMPGSGKSTVGPILADRLGARFVDLDEVVCASAGRGVTEIFATEGERGVRAREHTALEALVEADERVVVATGGGVVTTTESRTTLAQATCIWLEASGETLLARLANEASSRPLLADDPEGSVRRLREERDPLYRTVADMVVSTDAAQPVEVADRLVRLLEGATG
jgi:shikimate kinase